MAVRAERSLLYLIHVLRPHVDYTLVRVIAGNVTLWRAERLELFLQGDVAVDSCNRRGPLGSELASIHVGCCTHCHELAFASSLGLLPDALGHSEGLL